MKPPSAEVARAWFDLLYPDLVGWLCLFELPSRQATYFEDRGAAASHAAAVAGEQNVYFTVGLFGERPASGRGTEAQIAGIPGVWADIDVQGTAHKAQNLPPTIEAAKEILATIELRPTALVHSGHGLQAYWLFKEFWRFESEEERGRAKQLLIRWQAMLRAIAQRRNWTIDPTADLVRVLRVPGTLNRKLAESIRLVRYRADGPRYCIDELEGILAATSAAAVPEPSPARPNEGEPANLLEAVEACGWLRRCRDSAATLPEPEWYQLLTLVARCREAEKHAHDLSRPYPKYTPTETAQKLLQAREKSPGPVTCEHVQGQLGFAGCRECRHRGKVKSPIQLGRADRAPWPDTPPPEAAPRRSGAAEQLDTQIEQAIARHDAAAIYALAPQLADLRPIEYQLLRNRLRREFNRDIRISDLDLEIRAQRLLKAAPAAARGGWSDRLRLKDGVPRPILANALCALREAPEWKGVLAFDDFAQVAIIRRAPPWGGAADDREWSDNDDRLTAEWLQEHSIYVPVEIAGQAAQTVALEHRVHPPREYLGALLWDATPRLRTWLIRYCGAEQGEYTMQVGYRWMISAVARIFQPGCKADCCLVLEGQQGIRKSTTLSILGGKWFTDEISEFGTKDAALQARGVWIIEIAELTGLSRAEIRAINAFMSRDTDRFRPPYGKHLITSPRSCVFAGTSNTSDYHRDETGGRRFWPVACPGPSLDIDALQVDRDQLWAEAMHNYRIGAPWWLVDREVVRTAADEIRGRYQSDPWDQQISLWIENRESVTIHQVLDECIQKPKPQWLQADANRVARSLRAAGWRRCRAAEPDSSGKRPWQYLNPAYMD